MMCGLFGFAGGGYDREQLIALATLAGRRGPHACGWAWRDARGDHVAKFNGSAEENAEHLPEHAFVLVGHSRLATSGGHDDLDAAQPVIADGIWLAHNGIARLACAAPIMRTNCDSEALASIAADAAGTLDAKVRTATALLQADAPFALLVSNGHQLVGQRRGLPLFGRVDHRGAWFCSLAFAGARSLPETREAAHAE